MPGLLRAVEGVSPWCPPPPRKQCQEEDHPPTATFLLERLWKAMPTPSDPSTPTVLVTLSLVGSEVAPVVIGPHRRSAHRAGPHLC